MNYPNADVCGRCSFDARGRSEWRGRVPCVICRRATRPEWMTKCDGCNRFAHWRCVMGAMTTDQRDGGWRDLGRSPTTAVDRGTRTVVATRTVASGTEETVYVDGSSQTGVATRTVASGTEETVYVDGSSQTDVATCCVASGTETVHADLTSLAGVAACTVASGVQVKNVLSDCITTVVNVPSPVPEAIPSAATSVKSAAPTEPRGSGESARESTLSKTLKYWKMRYSLFSKFDRGIMLDEVSLYSVCPEILAQHMARRCVVGTVLDPFCGAGGNAIQLAFTCAHVIAIDLDPKKISLAKKNAKIYGVADRIDFRVGDSYRVAADLRVDAVVTSPPWGGPGYQRRAGFDPADLGGRECGGMAAILRMARAAAPKVVLHVPKNIDRSQCLKMVSSEGFGRIQFESVVIDRRPNCTNLYLSRNNTHALEAPVQTSRVVNLNTQSSHGIQKTRLTDNTLLSYSSYIDRVNTFLDQ